MTVRVLGIGNRFRRDDGIGPAVIDVLAPEVGDGVDARTCLCEPATLIEAIRDARAVILVDASAPGVTPGRIRRFSTATGVPGWQHAASTHGVSLNQALELAHALGAAPDTVVVYAVEGADFGHGEGLSPTLAAALPGLKRALCREIATLREATGLDGETRHA